MFFVILLSQFILAEPSISMSPHRWSVRMHEQGASNWKTMDLKSEYGFDAENLFEKAAEMKHSSSRLRCANPYARKGCTYKVLTAEEQAKLADYSYKTGKSVELPMHCGFHGGLMTTKFSGANEKVDVFAEYSFVNKNSAMRIFLGKKEERREVARPSFSFYPSGMPKRIKAGAIKSPDARNPTTSQFNRDFYTRLHGAITGKGEPIERNSPFAEYWTEVMQKSEIARACCHNDQCRTFVRDSKRPAPEGPVRQAELTEIEG